MNAPNGPFYLPPQPEHGDTREGNAFGILKGFGEAYAAHYRERRSFRIVYEARQVGSIGAWSLVSATVEATSKAEALERFRTERPRLEFRFPSECQEVRA